jgi:hypothetical protein
MIIRCGDAMTGHLLDFPEGYEEYACEVESKGWFGDARLSFSGRRYRLNFYDPVRLAQEIESELQRGRCFLEPNLVVVRSLTRPNMEAAAAQLIELGSVSLLIAE